GSGGLQPRPPVDIRHHGTGHLEPSYLAMSHGPHARMVQCTRVEQPLRRWRRHRILPRPLSLSNPAATALAARSQRQQPCLHGATAAAVRGSTILRADAGTSPAARALMPFYNSRRIFSNEGDTLDGLRAA